MPSPHDTVTSMKAEYFLIFYYEKFQIHIKMEKNSLNLFLAHHCPHPSSQNRAWHIEGLQCMISYRLLIKCYYKPGLRQALRLKEWIRPRPVLKEPEVYWERLTQSGHLPGWGWINGGYDGGIPHSQVRFPGSNFCTEKWRTHGSKWGEEGNGRAS